MCPSTYSHILHFPKEFRVSKNKAKSSTRVWLSFFWHISVFNHIFVKLTLILDFIFRREFNTALIILLNPITVILSFLSYCRLVILPFCNLFTMSSVHPLIFLYHHLVLKTLSIIACHPCECTVWITCYSVKGRSGWVSRT